MPKTSARKALRPRKSPRQLRSTATVEVILEAATRVLAKESLAGFNTNRVAQIAGVSVGSLYQYFPNKDALVAALIERTQVSLSQQIEQCVLDHLSAPFESAIGALVDVAIEHQFSNPVLAAALDHEERRLPMQPTLEQSLRVLVGSVARLLDSHCQNIAPLSHEHAPADCVAIVKAIVESGPAGTASIKARAIRAVLGYLNYQRPNT